MASSGIKDQVAIIGMGCTRFGELWDKGVDDLLTDAATEAATSANNSASFRHARSKLRNPGDACALAFRSPLRNFVRFGSTLQTAPVMSHRFGTRSSERPFALLKRLPATGPPFQGQSSWPIPSAQRSNLAGPVRSLRSSTPSG